MIDNRSPLSRRAIGSLVVLSGVFIFGTIGYVLIEGWSWPDALYMAVITLATVGFGEVHPLSDGGRLFTSFLILLGVGTVAYGLGALVDYVVNAELSGELRRRRMLRTLEQVRGHVIVCGFGRVGEHSADTLRQNKRTVVVIDNEEARAARARASGYLTLIGDATHDETLRQAGLERAAGLLVCTGDDSHNLFIVLSARTLNPGLVIVARSIAPETESKMLRAGASRVISPYQIGGRRMANAFLRPNVAEFLEGVSLDSGQELWIEEITIEAHSPLVGQSLRQVDMRRRTGVTLLAILRHNGLTPPDAEVIFQIDDRLIVIGGQSQIDALAVQCAPPVDR